MGYNITGLLIKGQIDETQIENFLETKITYVKDVDFEDATSEDRDENTIDILRTDSGALILSGLGMMYDLSGFDGEIIQFMISDISDTYYFEKCTRGDLNRKYIFSQGDLVENEGDGFNEKDDFTDQIWAIADQYLEKDFAANMDDQQFKRYQL